MSAGFFALGISCGFPPGLAAGIASGKSLARERIKEQLTQALADGVIAIEDSHGTTISVDQLFDLLDQKKMHDR